MRLSAREGDRMGGEMRGGERRGQERKEGEGEGKGGERREEREGEGRGGGKGREMPPQTQIPGSAPDCDGLTQCGARRIADSQASTRLSVPPVRSPARPSTSACCRPDSATTPRPRRLGSPAAPSRVRSLASLSLQPRRRLLRTTRHAATVDYVAPPYYGSW